MSRIPAAFGPFEPIRRLGAGGMAETFVAIRRGPGRFEQTVCIKRILPAYEGDAEFVAAFLDEARTSATLRHANIVQVLDFGVVDDTHYLALELIDGVDLRALLHPASRSAQRALPADIVTLIALDLAQALIHAHGPDPRRPEVAHRDISPSNVLLSTAGEIKLTDFGIARAANHTRRTRTGVLKGKVPYMPPEYIDANVFDARSDLHSLGVLLYELLTGARPFDGPTDIETVRRITDGKYARISGSGPAGEKPLRACIERLLAHDPAARFQSAHALADALPEVSTHHVRSRLADMVARQMEASTSRPAARRKTPTYDVPIADAVEAAPTVAALERPAQRATERIAQAAPVRVLGSDRTRTAARHRSRPPWSLLALGVGIATASALLVIGAHAASTRNAPPPQLPAPVSTPTPQASRAANAFQAAPGDAPRDQALTGAAVDAAVLTASGTGDGAPSVRDARLRVVVVPYGQVWVDGERVGEAPITVRVSRGPHVVAVGTGHIDISREIRAKPGEQPVTFRRDEDGHYRFE